MPQWADYVLGFIITLLFLLAILRLAGSSYGDWVREFYAKRDRLQTLFGNDKKKRN